MKPFTFNHLTTLELHLLRCGHHRPDRFLAMAETRHFRAPAASRRATR